MKFLIAFVITLQPYIETKIHVEDENGGAVSRATVVVRQGDRQPVQGTTTFGGDFITNLIDPNGGNLTILVAGTHGAVKADVTWARSILITARPKVSRVLNIRRSGGNWQWDGLAEVEPPLWPGQHARQQNFVPVWLPMCFERDSLRTIQALPSEIYLFHLKANEDCGVPFALPRQFHHRKCQDFPLLRPGQ